MVAGQEPNQFTSGSLGNFGGTRCSGFLIRIPIQRKCKNEKEMIGCKK